MSGISIRCERLGKSYVIGGERPDNGSLRDTLTELVRGSFRRLRQPHIRGRATTFWALRDVSFQVREGEALGIVGRNGAGKSTVLKILSRITTPSEGRAAVNGRVGSLLEIGTGFHPELTGRENIYLNGAILGLKKSDISQRFDEIVDFAGVQQFLDTPVKRYSSGMYVRLAFAVAAHLEPDILIIDEVLAVGDVEFQKRCLGRMGDVASEGRTVLFVSHSMSSIKALCDRALMLDGGRLVSQGAVNEVVDTYVRTALPPGDGFIEDGARRSGTGDARIRRVELLNQDGEPTAQLYLGQGLRVALTLEVKEKIESAVVEMGISSVDGTRVTSSFSVDGEQPPVELHKGWHKICLDLDPVLLPQGYTIDAALHRSGGQTIDLLDRMLSFTVLNVSESGSDSYPFAAVRGFVRPSGRWHPPEPVEPLYEREPVVRADNQPSETARSMSTDLRDSK